MSIKEEFVEVVLNPRTIKHYENLGYSIPRVIDKQGKLRVKRGTKIWVKVSDLLPDSTVKITAICENPNCPNPERILEYRQYRDICHDCAIHSEEFSLSHSGENSPMFGRTHTKEAKEKMSKAKKDKPKSEEHKRKCRVSALKRIERNLREGYQLTPFWNPVACDLIEQYGSTNGFNFQHAGNGGEYHIKYLGYFVDGYDKEKNVAIEIDEPKHFDSKGCLREEDILRQVKIENQLGCTFIRINFVDYIKEHREILND